MACIRRTTTSRPTAPATTTGGTTSPEEFELILKLGVWLRTQIEKGTTLGAQSEQKFAAYEARRVDRRKSQAKGDGVG